jgi:hypothetical protein
MLDLLRTGRGFTPAADGTPTHFTKLLVLDFFSCNIFLQSVADYSFLVSKMRAPELRAVLALSPDADESV